MTFLEAKQALARKLGIDYSTIANNDVFSESDLGAYINTACYMAWDLEFWDFTEHTKTATLDATSISNGYVNYPPEFAPSSIFYLSIGGEEYKKISIQGYRRFFEQNASATDKYWAEHKRLIFFNTNVAESGDTIDVYGKLNFVELSADADLLPFSPDTDAQQFSGNDAIVILAYAQALSSEKKKDPNQGAVEEKRAYGILQLLSNQLKAGRATEQPKNTPMFKVPDYFARRGGSTNGSPIGGFNQ